MVNKMGSPSVSIEDSRQVIILAVSTVCILIPSLLVALRAATKLRVMGRLDASDCCILAALLFNTGMQIDSWVMMFKGGFGLHAADIFQRFGPETLEVFYKGLFLFPLVWNVTMPLSKISVLLMYLSVIPFDPMLLAVRIIAGFVIAFNVGSFIAGLLICTPIAYNWDRTIPGGHCGSILDYYTAMGFINLIIDVVIVVLPMPYLYKLLLAWPKKLFAMGMFGIGLCTVAVTAYRQAILPSTDILDMPYSGVLAILLSGIEPAVAIAMACLPLLKPLFRPRPKEASDYVGSNRSRGRKGQGTGPHHASSTDEGSGPFEQLDDNSSEIQLRPRDNKTRVVITSEHTHAKERSDIITVRKDWEVRSVA